MVASLLKLVATNVLFPGLTDIVRVFPFLHS